MNWSEVEVGLKETQTVIRPVGATEEHGSHLPTVTETIQAIEVARAVAAERRVFLAPRPWTTEFVAARGAFPAPSPPGTMPCVLNSVIFNNEKRETKVGFQNPGILGPD